MDRGFCEECARRRASTVDHDAPAVASAVDGPLFMLCLCLGIAFIVWAAYRGYHDEGARRAVLRTRMAASVQRSPRCNDEHPLDPRTR